MNVKRIKHSVCLQHDSSDCGVACLLSVIKFFGGEETFDNLRELSGTNVQGTTLLGLHDAALSKGLAPVSLKGDIKYLKNIEAPHIIHITTDTNLLHYVVVWGYSEDAFFITDPAVGFTKWSDLDVERQWKSKVCMSLSKTDNFVVSHKIEEAKKKWIVNIIKEDWSIYVVSVILGGLSAVLGMSTSVFSQKLLDRWIPQHNVKQIIVAMCFLMVLLVIRLFASAARSWLMCKQSKMLNISLMGTFFQKIIRKPLNFFEHRKTGDLVSRLGDVPKIQNVICSVVGGNLILNILFLFAVVVVLLHYSSFLSLFVFFMTALMFGLMTKFNGKIKFCQYGVMSSYANVESNFISAIQGIRTFMVYGGYDKLDYLNNSLYEKCQNATFSLGKLSIKLSVYYGLVTTIVIIAVMLYGSLSVVYGNLSVGGFTAVISLVTMVMPCIIELSMVPISINEAKVAFDRVYDISTLSDQTDECKISCARDSVINISAKCLCFRYICNPPIINKLSFEFKVGNTYGVIGESGAGKSTLCKLLEGSYAPTSGLVLINNQIQCVDVNSADKAFIIGSATQDVSIVNGTILDNICLYADTSDDYNKVVNVCTKYGLERFIERFKMGLYTIVGETGVKLSGGEKQMIGLIRLLYKNPKILVLDEPTASMDSEMEVLAMNIVSKIKRDAIVILVTHKFKILKNYADEICILENGTFTKKGTHKELMNSDNLYSRFWLEAI